MRTIKDVYQDIDRKTEEKAREFCSDGEEPPSELKRFAHSYALIEHWDELATSGCIIAFKTGRRP